MKAITLIHKKKKYLFHSITILKLLISRITFIFSISSTILYTINIGLINSFDNSAYSIFIFIYNLLKVLLNSTLSKGLKLYIFSSNGFTTGFKEINIYLSSRIFIIVFKLVKIL